MNLKTLLDEEIQNEFKQLKTMELGTESYKTTVDGMAKLMEKSIELKKFDFERQEKTESLDFDSRFKLEQAKDEQRDRRIKNSIAIAGIVLPIIVTVWGTKVSLNFEKTDNVTTIMGRGFINKLLPKK